MNKHFNIEQAISEWRRQLLAAGINAPVPLEELENHLREEIERQIKLRVDEQEAFEISVRQIGKTGALKDEFNKIERTRMKRKMMIGAGIVGLLLGAAMILPALGMHRQRNQAAINSAADFFNARWAANEVYGLEWGVSLAVLGAGTAFFGFKKRKTAEHYV